MAGLSRRKSKDERLFWVNQRRAKIKEQRKGERGNRREEAGRESEGRRKREKRERPKGRRSEGEKIRKSGHSFSTKNLTGQAEVGGQLPEDKKIRS
jgi:hypothetical protein